jgi:hypothetical protein
MRGTRTIHALGAVVGFTVLAWPTGARAGPEEHRGGPPADLNPCASAPSDGAYCGQSTQWAGAKHDVLYHCEGGVTKSRRYCAFGCDTAEAGVEDTCKSPPPAGVVLAPVAVARREEPTEPAEKIRVLFRFDFRLGGFYAAGPSGADPTGGLTVGFQLGASTWFTRRFGFRTMVGPDIGYLTHPKDGTVIVAGQLGPEFQVEPSSSHRDGIVLAVVWAPRLFVNFSGGEVGAPIGAEVIFKFGPISVPFWFARALDDGTFFGAGLELGY